MPKKRVSKLIFYRPSLLTQKDRLIAQDLIEGLDPNAAARRQRYKNFKTFCKMNSLRYDTERRFGKALALHAGQLIRFGRMYSTVKQYCQWIRQEYSHPTTPQQTLMRTLGLLTANSDRNHAVDLSVSEIQALIWHLHFMSPKYGAVAYFMWATGMRFQDIRWLQDFRVLWSQKGIHIEVRISKTARVVLARKELFIPTRLLPPIDSLIPQTLAGFLSIPGFFENINLDAFNEWLHVASEESGRAIDLDNPTSYSIRRSAMHRFIAEFTAEDGTIDFAGACRYSMHDTPKTLEAFYHRHVSDCFEQSA
jgi:integrase